jgi:ubiquinone/menaquinone biosynthesis C-methylase UbiE
MKTRPRASSVTTEEEREFQRQQIGLQRERYLSTDVLDRVRYDEGYAAKVALIEGALTDVDGWILDIGSNTCGEAEVLSTRGHSLIAMDINEVALAISKERVAVFGRLGPEYVAGDAQSIPLQDGEVSVAICYEALHHLPEPQIALQEIHRVLAPGGRLFFFEPYSYNPYRRLSEIRDWMRGTIEKSFGRREITTMMKASGLRLAALERKVLPPSVWKRATVSPLWWRLRELYYRVGQIAPQVFGNLCGIATKGGELESRGELKPLDAMLRCPVSGARIMVVSDGFLSLDAETRLLYPSHAGIPVMGPGDGVALSRDAWLAAQEPAS